MHKKTIFPIVLIVTFMTALFSTAGAAVPSSQQQVQIRAERMQLEKAKKKMLMSCDQFKESNPDNYTRCVSEYTVRHEANVQLLMKDPDAYFARKEASPKK
jgi:hypothetical protein